MRLLADGNRGRVDKGDAGCLASLTQAVERQRQQGGWHQLDKARIADQTGKFSAHLLPYVSGIVCLEITIMRLVKVDQKRHRFTHAQPGSGSSFAPHAQLLRILPGGHPLTKIIDMTE